MPPSFARAKASSITGQRVVRRFPMWPDIPASIIQVRSKTRVQLYGAISRYHLHCVVGEIGQLVWVESTFPSTPVDSNNAGARQDASETIR